MSDKKIIGVIPARYESTRFPGKPLVDICGKPMIWWVYNQVKKVKQFAEIYVATDDERIELACKKYGMNVLMTSNNHPTHIHRVHEVSNKVKSDYYLCVNGDEPLIEVESIAKVIESAIVNQNDFFTGAFRYLADPAETIDSANIKIVTDNSQNKYFRCVYLSRTPIPYPKNSLNFKYKKYVGIECFTKAALDFFVSCDMGLLEKVEDIDHLRFIEANKNLYFVEVNSKSISVDTCKDLEKVHEIISKNIINTIKNERIK